MNTDSLLPEPPEERRRRYLSEFDPDSAGQGHHRPRTASEKLREGYQVDPLDEDTEVEC